MFRLLKDTLCKRCVFFGLNCEKKVVSTIIFFSILLIDMESYMR